jgi:hypothetical protein
MLSQCSRPISKNQEAKIREAQRARAKSMKKADIRLTPEEIVEDAGLHDDPVGRFQRNRKHRGMKEVTQWA